MNKKFTSAFNSAEIEYRKDPLREIRSDLRFICILLTILLLLIGLIPAYVYETMTVSGSSMEPTLHDGLGDKVGIWKMGNIQYGDVVIVWGDASLHTQLPEDEYLVKRVIGLEGDTISLHEYDSGKYYIKVTHSDQSSIVLEKEPYILQEMTNSYKNNTIFPIHVKAGEVCVLGDNRQVSLDSSRKDIGCFQVTDIVGKVILLIRDGKLSRFVNTFPYLDKLTA